MERSAENRKREKERKETYGRKVFPISKSKYFEMDTLTNYQSQISPSNIKSVAGEIKISTKQKQLIFKNHNDPSGVVGVEDHSIVGQVDDLRKVIVRSSYRRHVEYQIIDLASGKIDTIPDYPSFSPSLKYVASNAFYSKDTIHGGLHIYTIYKGNINLMGKRGAGKWMADQMFWLDDKTIYAKIVKMEDGDFQKRDFEYVKIDLNYF
ncbi:MAG: hypothetical protein AAF573_18925 [Bacteroidota bacterium]